MYAWHEGMDMPLLIAGKDTHPLRNHVTSFALLDGFLYHAGYGKNIVVTGSSSTAMHPNIGPLFGLTNHRYSLHVLEYGPSHRVVLRNDGNGEYPIDSLLDIRNHVLDMASDGRRLFIASQNVVMCEQLPEEIKLTRLSGFKADRVLLAADGEKVYATHFQNPHTHPSGQVFELLPEGSTVRNIDLSVFNMSSLKQFAVQDDVLIFGVSLDQTMAYYTTPINDKEAPLSLVTTINARRPEVYGTGNALIAVPLEDLVRIIIRSQHAT